jgi:hypothetical protein
MVKLSFHRKTYYKILTIINLKLKSDFKKYFYLQHLSIIFKLDSLKTLVYS